MKPERLRALVLAEWRGLPQPVERPERTALLGDAVRKVMASLGLKDRLRSEEVLQSWHGIVGDFVARHSSPQQLKDGVLTVRVLQPTVHFELERVWKRDILAKLRERFGKNVVRDVKFRIG
jgi:predicted nucleic acid-binding Zn ribbon protein